MNRLRAGGGRPPGIGAGAGASVGAVRDTLGTLAGPDQRLQIRSNRWIRSASLEIFERTFAITWQVVDSKRPFLALRSEPAHGDGSGAGGALQEAALRARRCMAPGQGLSGARALELHWSVREGSDVLSVSGVATAATSGLSPAAKACLRSTFTGLRLDREASEDALGAATADLSVPGRAGVVVPNGTLFGDGVCARVKEELLKDFNLHTIVRFPNGVFAPYTPIPTNLLFFDR